MKENKIKYKAYSFRLNERTILELAKIHKEKGISWNKFFVELIKRYENILH